MPKTAPKTKAAHVTLTPKQRVLRRSVGCSGIRLLRDVMAALRAPDGCPWDREQNHHTLRFHAVEEVYELIDAIEAGDLEEMIEELGDILLQVVFHCQLGAERGDFDFDIVCLRIAEKLIRRHPHVFGDAQVKTVDGVWAQWEKIKRAEKVGTRHARPSALDGIPRHLPALMRAEKLAKKARKSGLLDGLNEVKLSLTQNRLGDQLYELASYAQSRGWHAEDLLRREIVRREKLLKQRERSLQAPLSQPKSKEKRP